ncbi:MAG: hypothetical protein OXD42_09110 [Rhodospirillaceae bacterium]|nr:hypothetical protein [Rhodospirillaceae bacterium]
MLQIEVKRGCSYLPDVLHDGIKRRAETPVSFIRTIQGSDSEVCPGRNRPETVFDSIESLVIFRSDKNASS